MSDLSPAPRTLDPAVERILGQFEGAQRRINYSISDAITAVYALEAVDDGKSGPAPTREMRRLVKLNTDLASLTATQPVGDDEAAERVSVMQQLQAALSATRGVLVAQASFPGDGPERAQARALEKALFGEGARLQRKRHRDLWLLADRVITKLDADTELAFQLEFLVGPWAAGSVRRLHGIAGRLLGITAAPRAPVSVDLMEKLREHREQAAAYERAVLGEMDAHDPASVRRAQALLAPLVKLREEQSAARASGGADADEPEGAEAAPNGGATAPVGAGGPATATAPVTAPASAGGGATAAGPR